MQVVAVALIDMLQPAIFVHVATTTWYNNNPRPCGPSLGTTTPLCSAGEAYQRLSHSPSLLERLSPVERGGVTIKAE